MIGKPEGVIVYQVTDLGVGLGGLEITQGEFIDSIFMLDCHDSAIGLVQEGDGQNSEWPNFSSA